MEKLLTVVVPVYKVEQYIHKCLDSLIVADEWMERVEVLVVNDGTPDRSAMMAKEYEQRYPQTFRVIDKENGGHGSAWNRGVEEAKGKYLRFLDSDDWLTNYEAFLERLSHLDVDLVFTDLDVFHQDTGVHNIYQLRMATDTPLVVDDFNWDDTDDFFLGYNFTNFHMCTYRTKLLQQYQPLFDEKVFYDDEILFVMPLCTAKRMAYVDLILYNYLLGRTGQTMDAKVAMRNLEFKFRVREKQIRFVRNHPVTNERVARKLNYILNSRSNHLFRLMTGLGYKECQTMMAKWDTVLRTNFPQFEGSRLYHWYKALPYPLFRMAVKLKR